jgi:hypothetical protein
MASGLPLGQIAVTRCAVIVDQLILPDPPKPWLGSFAKKAGATLAGLFITP